MTGPLNGLKVVEMQGLGPAPFCGMVLADLGAEVLRIARPGTQQDAHDVLERGRQVLTLDLRDEAQRERALALIARADVLIEGFRPGVMERLGLGPDACHARNPALVYGRMTGWGQTGPLSHAAGHDINYISISGALHAVGPANQKPSIPLNYVGDFGGGAMLLAVGVLSALHESRRTGRGQVVDAALYESVLQVMESLVVEYDVMGIVRQRSGSILPGIAPSNVYPCADGEYMIGANGDAIFARLAQAMGRPELATDERYATHIARGQHQAELDGLIAAWTKTLSVAALEARIAELRETADRLAAAA